MGTNIIDAFVVTFGMDTSNFQSGEKRVTEGTKKVRDESKKTFDDIENMGKRVGMSFRSVRNEVAGLLLLFTGGRSILDFASNMLRGEAAASRMSDTLGVATGRIVAWQKAIRNVGGNPGEADAALGTIAKWKAD